LSEEIIKQLQAEISELERLLADKKRLLIDAQDQSHIQESKENSIRPELSAKLPAKIDFSNKLSINNHSPPEDKIALFRSLFRGREDIFAKRFESKKTGKAGYQPACRNEWVRGICGKPKINCGSCTNRAFEPVSDSVIRNHLAGHIPATYEGGPALPFVMGLYPLLQNETCHLLAIDFDSRGGHMTASTINSLTEQPKADSRGGHMTASSINFLAEQPKADKQSWQEDVKAFFETCQTEGIPASVERSRSGNGAHIWIFFDHPIPASKARKLGSFLMTRTLDRRPEIGLDSFDRFFPNQDTLPKGGFGNLIALPLQKAAREKNHSIFLDDTLTPYQDQWAYLSSIERINEEQLDLIIRLAAEQQELLPVAWQPENDSENEEQPWQKKSENLPAITELLPSAIEVVISDQVYINHTGLPAILRNRILRLASFSNPEFYKAQAMRLPTWNKPRILYCYEFFPKYIGLPIGCFDDLKSILEHYHISPQIDNKQNHGAPIAVQFKGELRDEQKKATQAILANTTGILSASTAFGKTVVALWLIAERKVNTLILVHRKQLMDQWIERIVQFLGIPKKEIGCIGGGRKKRTGIIDIAVMQSLSRKNKVEDWVSDYGQIIVDECHHISASSFEQIIRKCSAYFRLGLSATVIRKDGQHPIVIMNLGNIRYTYHGNSKALNFTQKIIPRFTDFSLTSSIEKNQPAIQDVFRDLWNNEERNSIIVRDVLETYKEGRECLVLSERLEHLDMLKKLLLGKIDNLFILKGGMGKKQLKTIMDGINTIPDTGNRVILATGKYPGEGFDLPCLDTLFLVFPFSWRGTLTQYVGRLNRTYYGKTEIRVYDYVDDKVPVLSRMYGRRLKGYKALGFSV
jgi:superfamily II DNA or RNA helicase